MTADDAHKTREELIAELAVLRRRVIEAEAIGIATASLARRAPFEDLSFQQIMEAIGDPVSIQAPDFAVLYQNPSHMNLSGDQRGKLCFQAYAGKDTVCEECPVARVFDDGGVHTLTKEGNAANGILLVEITAAPLRDKFGNVVAAVEVVRDATARRKAEEDLRRAEEMFRSLVEESLVGIYIMQAGRFPYINPRAAEIFGYSPEEITSSIEVRQLISEEDHGLVAEDTQNLLDGKAKSAHSILRGKRKDGAAIEIETQGSLTEYRGKPAIIGTFLDITSRRRMEAELQKTRRIEALGMLAGGIAHEFNNILTAVLGNLSLAKMYAKPGYEVYDVLSEAEKASHRAKDLTLQLLAFSKGGAPVKSVLSMPGLLRNLFALSFGDDVMKPSFSIPDDLWVVGADEQQISQVVTSIASHAGRAIRAGDVIDVSAENVVIAEGDPLPVTPGRYVRTVVSFRGESLPRGDMERIFDPFSFPDGESSAGLGLASAYTFVKRHGGHMLAEMDDHGRQRFILLLPAADEKRPAETGQVYHRSGRGKVLVMDDEEAVRAVLQRLLNQCGCEVVLSHDGEEMLRRYQEAMESGEPFEAVIMDLIVQEGMGGLEAIHRLFEIDPKAIAIVSSGYSNDPAMASFREYGFSGVLAKPYKLEELRRVLHDVLGRPG